MTKNSSKNLKLINEVWVDIIGFEGLYKLSNLGKIFNIKSNKILKNYYVNTRGYYVSLRKDNNKYKKSVGKLVAEHFVLNPNNYKYFYYIDGNNKHCYASNIQWNVTTRNTKLVVDGIIFESNKAYQEFCKINQQAQYLLDLEEICEFNIKNRNKVINAQFKY